MTTASPTTVPMDGRTRSFRRRWLLLALIVGVIAAGWSYLWLTERSRTLAAIEAAGGKYQAPPPENVFARVLQTILSGSDESDRYDVYLSGPEFDDAWLARHHELRSVSMDQLILANTHVSRAAAMRLLERNRLMTFSVPGVPLTDADAAVIGQQKRLTHLTLMQSEISDAGFSALRPQRLTAVNVAGTRVTTAALRSGLTGPRLQFVGVDGRQFTAELAAQLGKMRTVNMISLMGPDITDAHVKLLEAMPNLVWIGIVQTSASDDAVATLKAVNPKATVDVFDAKSAYFKWRGDLPSDDRPATDGN